MGVQSRDGLRANLSQDLLEGYMTNDNADKRLQIGPKMREAWAYILAHPGCSEYEIKITYDRRLLARLVKSEMVELRPSIDGPGHRCFVRHEWQYDVTKRRYGKDSAYHRARKRVYGDYETYTTACGHVGCKGSQGQPCTGDYYGHPRTGPHYERLIVKLNQLYELYIDNKGSKITQPAPPDPTSDQG